MMVEKATADISRLPEETNDIGIFLSDLQSARWEFSWGKRFS